MCRYTIIRYRCHCPFDDNWQPEDPRHCAEARSRAPKIHMAERCTDPKAGHSTNTKWLEDLCPHCLRLIKWCGFCPLCKMHTKPLPVDIFTCSNCGFTVLQSS